MAQYPASTGSKLLVTKSNTAGEASLGSVAVTGSNGTSSYGQISASLAADTLVTRVSVVLGSSTFTLTEMPYVEIAVGGAGSEAVVGTVPLTVNYNSTSTRVAAGALVIPCRVAGASRLAVRLTDSSLFGVTVNFKVYGAAYTNVEGN